jgi:glycosyltransferase involved in cell wall biosynthesis
MIELSIIIPVYNVEKYVHTCLESIFKQGLDDASFEVILVNDGSTDHSMEMIEDIISQHRNITVINQENQGLSVARNNGIAAAKGEYILMPDSDDLLIENSLKPLLDKALEIKVDLVVADFLQMSNDEIDTIKNSPHQQNEELRIVEKSGEQLFLENINSSQPYVWRILYRREFIIQQQLKFHPGIYVQDKPFFYESYLKAEKCLITSKTIYIYRKHKDGISFLMKEKYAKDYCYAIGLMWNLSNLDTLAPRIQERMRDYTYMTLSSLMTRLTYELKDKNKSREIIRYLNTVAPELRFHNGIKQRLITFLLRSMPLTYISLRYMYAKHFERKLYPAFRHLLQLRNA